MVFIVSWNVASWPTTATVIRQCYGDNGGDGRISTFLNRFGADVIALQEAKVSKKKLAENPFDVGACDRSGNELENWESFWCPSDQRGMNGVVTFARKGLVHRADSAALRVPEFDNEGRCLVTVFSHFVLFNVYVVNARGGTRYDFKVRFLEALELAIVRYRQQYGLPVILAGDCNITYRTVDCHWTNRRLDLKRLQDFLPDDRFDEGTKEKLLATIAAHCSNRSPPLQINNSSTQPHHHDVVPQQCASAVTDRDNFSEEPNPADAGLWVETFIRGESHSIRNKAWYLAAACDVAGETSHRGKDKEWLQRLLSGPSASMVDSFVVCNPAATCCYTAFDQYRNKRFSNEGNRIDYILVDNSLAPFLSSSVDGSPPHKAIDEWNQQEAVALTTAHGVFRPAPMDGGGLPDVHMSHANTMFDGLPRTGLVYTPPQFSDHLGVCCLLKGLDLVHVPLLGHKPDAATLKCQYRTTVKTLDCFFKKISAGPSSQQKATAPRSTNNLPMKRVREDDVIDVSD